MTHASAPRFRTGPARAAVLVLLALAVLAALAACRGQTPQMTFYTLTPIDEAASPGGGPSVGVGPLAIPRVIDRPHIVTREGDNRLHLAEFQRWGGPLEGEVLGVLTRNLSALLESEQVTAYPWTGFMEPDYRVPVDILRLDGGLDGEVVLTATWGVAGPGSERAASVHTFHVAEPVDGDGYPDLVAAHSRALAALSRAIAGEIDRMRGK